MKKRFLEKLILLFVGAIISALPLLAAETASSKPEVSFYGFIKLDASYDDSKTDNPDAPKFAVLENAVSNERQFAMTAQNTRLGCKLISPQSNDGKVFANLELDFFDTSSDNSQKPRMRHAFFELQHPKWSLLAGQTWDVFGPLGPDTLNTNGYMWFAGNVGFRRPQIRLTNNMDCLGNKIVTQVSLNRNIGISNSSVDTGENYGLPIIEGRAAYTFPLFTKKSTIGVAGLWGKERYNRFDGINDNNYTVAQESLGIDLFIPCTDQLSFKGELYAGSNVDAFLGGIGQGLNTVKEKGISAKGGWSQASYLLNEKHTINLGYGQDNAQEDDLNLGNRSKNEVFYGNLMCALAKDVKMGLEYAHFQTKYAQLGKGINNRITASLIYTY